MKASDAGPRRWPAPALSVAAAHGVALQPSRWQCDAALPSKESNSFVLVRGGVVWGGGSGAGAAQADSRQDLGCRPGGVLLLAEGPLLGEHLNGADLCNVGMP